MVSLETYIVFAVHLRLSWASDKAWKSHRVGGESL